MAKRRPNPFKVTGKPITRRKAPAKRTSQNVSLSTWDFDGLTSKEMQLLQDDYEEAYLAGKSSTHKPVLMPDQSDAENEYLYKQYLMSKTPTAAKKTSTPKKKSAAKPAAKKTSTTKKVKAYQTGRSNLKMDEKRKAKLPGKRKSASGRTYYERRKNRSDTEAQRRAFSKKK